MTVLKRFWSTPTLLIAFCALCWSGNSVIGRAAPGVIAPAALSFWRWTVAAALMGVIARHQLHADRALIRRHWRILSATALLGVATFGLLLYVGLRYTTAVNSLLMQASMPALTMLLMLLLYGERPNPVAVAGSLVAVAGVALIACRGSLAVLVHLSLNPGDAIVLVATLIYAVYSIVVAKGPRLPPLLFAAVTFAFAAAALLPAWIGEMLLFRGPAIGAVAIGTILFCGIFPSCLAYLCYNRAVALAGPAAATSVTLMMPLFGSLMAVLFLGERLAPFHFAGGTLILAGILLSRRRTAPAAG